MNRLNFLQGIERDHVLEDLIASQLEADRNLQMDIGYRQQTPGYPEYAEQARADIAPTPLDAVSLMGIPFISDAAGFASDVDYLATEEDPEWWRYGLAGAGLLPGIPAGLGTVKSTKKALEEVPGFRDSWRYMTPEERALVESGQSGQAARTIQNVQKAYPSPAEMATVAQSGGAKRGWYEHSANATDQVFGPRGPEIMGPSSDMDASRFVRGLAALSPQTSVESNLRNWLNTWTNWNAARRPQDPNEILQILGRSVEGDKGIGSVLDAWRNNAYRALVTSDEDLAELTLSGPKVNSFGINLDPNIPFDRRMNEFTNDAWMANYGLVDQNLFSGAGRKGMSDQFSDLGIKGPGYIGVNVAGRKAAEQADMHPAEVQETIWSWAKTLLEDAESAGMTPSQYLKAGMLSDEAIGATPSFDQLFREGEYADLLRAGGYGPRVDALTPANYGALSDPYTRVGLDPAMELNQSREGRHLLAAGRRLDRLQDRRAAEAAVRAQRGVTDVAREAGPLPQRQAEELLRQEEIRRRRLNTQIGRSPHIGLTPKEKRELGYEFYTKEERKRLGLDP